LDGVKVEFEDFTSVVGINLSTIISSEKTLSLKISFNVLNVFFRSASQSKVLDSLFIHREITHSGTVFGTHIGDSSSISEVQRSATRAVEFNEFADDTSLSEHLGDGQDQISSSGDFIELASKSETDDLRKNHGDGFTEHDGFGFNPTDTPTDNTETVNHGGVGISTDDGIRVQQTVSVEDGSGQVFQVDLMDDT